MGKSISKLFSKFIDKNGMKILVLGLGAAAWDVGGADQSRLLWNEYSKSTQALIYVVDSSDIERVEQAREELFRMLAEEELRDTPLLVFANKQDIGVMSIAQVTEKLGFNSIEGRQWHIQGTCAITGDGLYEGLQWLTKTAQLRK